MEADSTQETSLAGFYSMPIRAPLTIDSDSDFCLSINNDDNVYSRTSSFNSSCSSIDISNYGDEHTSVLEEENDGFLGYPDKEIVLERSKLEEFTLKRPFVKYPDDEIVLERSKVEEFTLKRPFVKYPDDEIVLERSKVEEYVLKRPFVKYPCDESSSGCKLSVPVAPLSSDFDSDVDSVDGCRWLEPGRGSDDGVGQKVVMALKVGVLGRGEGEDGVDDELQVESVSLDADIDGLNSVSAESMLDEGCKDDCPNEVMKCLELDGVSFDLERIDAQVISSSNDEIESRTINGKHLELDELSFDILEGTDAQVVSDSKNEIEIESFNVKHSKVDELSFDILEGTDAQAVSDSINKIEIGSFNVKHSESNELSFDIVERTDEQVLSDSTNETQIGTINESEQEVVFDSYRDESKKKLSERKEETLAKMQPIMAKFLSLALEKQLAMEVNGEGSNDKFDRRFTILVIGKTGVGKSATINSIFGQKKALTNAFNLGTTTIQEIAGNIEGIQLRVVDTPGLSCSPSERSYNARVLKSIKRFTRTHTPDVLLYVDRLDIHARDVIDSQLLRLITSSLGCSVWHNTIIALTHATSNLPDEPSGGFMFQRCRFIQEQIVRFGGCNQHMVNPVWLVENHPSHKQDIINLDGELEGLMSFNQANEDESDQISSHELFSESCDVTRRSMERKKAYFKGNSHRVKLLGNKHWSLACRLYS